MAGWENGDAPVTNERPGSGVAAGVPIVGWEGDSPVVSDVPMDVGTSQGADFLTRAGAALKITPEGKQGFLESRLGPTVQERPGIGYTYRDQGGREQAVDEFGPDIGDVADVAGAVMTAAPTLAQRTGNPFLAAILAGSGSALRQGVAAMLPGDEDLSIADRAGMIMTDAMMAGGMQGAINKGAQLFDKARPRNIVARHVQKAENTPFAQRGRELQKEVGVRFSPGQATGSGGVITVQGVARRHPVSEDRVAAFDLRNLDLAKTRLDKLMDSIDKTARGSEGAGSVIWTAYDDVIKWARNARRAQAKADFGEVEKLSGGAARISTPELRSTVDKLIQDYTVPGGGDATSKLVGQLRRLRGELGDATNPQQMQRLLEVYGKAASGKGQLLHDIDTAQQRGIAGQMFGALNRDLDNAADEALQAITATSGGGARAGEEAARALVIARDNYRKASGHLDTLADTIIGRMFNSKGAVAPEAVAGKFLTAHPSQIRTVVKILETSKPDALAAIQRNMIEEAMDASKATVANAGTSGGAVTGSASIFSPRKFNSWIANQEERLAEVFANQPGALKDLRTINEAMGRLADRAGTDGSPTSPLAWALDIARSTFSLTLAGMARAGGQIVAPAQLAKIMTTPEGRKALITMTATSSATKARTAAAATLGAIIAKDKAVTSFSTNEAANQGENTANESPDDDVIGAPAG